MTLDRMRGAIRLLAESLDSYERNGGRTVDKLDNDLRTAMQACADLRVAIARYDRKEP